MAKLQSHADLIHALLPAFTKEVEMIKNPASMTMVARPSRQRGIGLLGFILFLGLLGFLGIIAAKSVPAWNEYFAVKRALNRIATDGDPDANSARKSFERYATIDRIVSVTPEDIKFTPGERGMKGAFEYDSRIHVAGNLFLVFVFTND